MKMKLVEIIKDETSRDWRLENMRLVETNGDWENERIKELRLETIKYETRGDNKNETRDYEIERSMSYYIIHTPYPVIHK